MDYEPEDNGEIDNATLIAIIRSHYGPEAQAAALNGSRLAGMNGDPRTRTEAGNNLAPGALRRSSSPNQHSSKEDRAGADGQGVQNP